MIIRVIKKNYIALDFLLPWIDPSIGHLPAKQQYRQALGLPCRIGHLAQVWKFKLNSEDPVGVYTCQVFCFLYDECCCVGGENQSKHQFPFNLHIVIDSKTQFLNFALSRFAPYGLRKSSFQTKCSNLTI